MKTAKKKVDMGLFDFGKKKKENKAATEEKEKKDTALSKRQCDRYHVDNLYIEGIGKILDVSKNGAAIEKREIEEVKKTKIEIKIQNLEKTVEIKRQTLKEMGVMFEESLKSVDFFEKYVKKPHRINFRLERNISENDIEKDERLDTVKAVINLMLELDDPNTTVVKFKTHIEALPELEAEIIKKANSVEKAGKMDISSISNAITRLGFDEVKRLTYEHIDTKISMSNVALDEFEHYEMFGILKTAIFKKLAPLFSFRDLRSEGRSLLVTDIMGITFMADQADEKFKKFFKTPKELYSYTARVMEERTFGKTMIEVNKHYFEQVLGFFQYLYDGYLMAHLLRHPYIEYPESIKMTLSSRKLRFSYVAYLTILALEFILSSDKRSGYILLNRLKRFGMDNSKAISFLNETIFDANEMLENIGVKDKIRSVSLPTFSISMERILGKELHFSAYADKIKIVDQSTKRAAFRYEDPFFANFLIDLVLNASDYSFEKMPFCIVPCDILDDEDLKLEMFSGFDLIIFKNIDKLKEELFEEFSKIWRDFEGNVFVTYNAYSFIDFKNEKLHKILRDFIIDTPSYFDSKKVYETMLKIACSDINKEFDKDLADPGSFRDKIYTMDSIYKKSVDKYFNS
ncbi:HDOD domain-containing protein [Nitrosophilus alvini]|uniref:HDOD domain-containing protein n=1 Tax=Nitrosophilus alvini TaxID=2714855 RepID=UPI00190980A0|nr:HDOD domain-containing protein [Nitrosophilus alvini]